MNELPYATHYLALDVNNVRVTQLRIDLTSSVQLYEELSGMSDVAYPVQIYLVQAENEELVIPFSADPAKPWCIVHDLESMVPGENHVVGRLVLSAASAEDCWLPARSEPMSDGPLFASVAVNPEAFRELEKAMQALVCDECETNETRGIVFFPGRRYGIRISKPGTGRRLLYSVVGRDGRPLSIELENRTLTDAVRAAIRLRDHQAYLAHIEGARVAFFKKARKAA